MLFRHVSSRALWPLAGALLLCAASATAATVCPDSKLCFATKIVDITKRDGSTAKGVQLMINSTAGGWVGFGIGSSMADADMVVVEPTGESIAARVTDMRSTGRQMPARDSQQDWMSVDLSAGKYVIQRAVDTGDANDKVFKVGEQDYIWAYGSGVPALGYHGATRGSLLLDAFDESGTGSAAGGGPLFKAALAHGLLMFFAWGLFSYFGIWAARFGKSVFGKNWFPIHMGALGAGTGLLTIAAFIVMVVQLDGLYLTSLHNILGFVILIVMIGQIILGKVIDRMYQPDRLTVPARDKAHWWLGRFLVTAGAVNIFLGLYMAGAATWLYVVFGVWLVAAAGVFSFSQYRANQSARQKATLNGNSTAGLQYEAELHAT